MTIDTINLNVAIERDLADAARAAVSRGGYASLDDVVGEALRDWKERAADREHDTARLKAAIERAANNPVRLSEADVRNHLRKLMRHSLQRNPRDARPEVRAGGVVRS